MCDAGSIIISKYPANTTRWPNDGLMLTHLLRRWPNIVAHCMHYMVVTAHVGGFVELLNCSHRRADVMLGELDVKICDSDLLPGVKKIDMSSLPASRVSNNLPIYQRLTHWTSIEPMMASCRAEYCLNLYALTNTNKASLKQCWNSFAKTIETTGFFSIWNHDKCLS